MDKRELKALLEGVSSGGVSVSQAEEALRTAAFSDLGFAKVDHQRGVRQGVSEVIYGAGKTPDQIAAIAASLLQAGEKAILITRVDADAARTVQQQLADEVPEGAQPPLFTYYDTPRLAVAGEVPVPDGRGPIAVAAAGTSDIPVAEEAALTAEVLGNEVLRLYDVGVAGLHRLLAQGEALARATVVVAVAGMEGALPSVVAGLVSCPVIAVPTSVGYGASFGGVAALLAMLNSCASGVSVVNIDNGFGAGYQASLINHIA